MASNKKKELIQQTYEILKEIGPANTKIRTIAQKAHCTSTVIYRHFDNLDHLILFASVKFLEDYIIDIQEIINTNTDAFDMLIQMWNNFAKYAFKNIDVFELLFWGKNKETLGDIIFEYYQIFPAEWKGFDGLFTSIFFSDDLKGRNQIMVRRAAAMGYFSYDDVTVLSDLQYYFFHGLMMDYKDCYKEPGKSEEATKLFMDMLNSLICEYRIK